ncbi:hypothetical protein [Iamia sp.]|uniref:TolB family protein n=1 Tax=Iamia sp. TaxID=2722710 RepID=UPI002C50691E|nr:hypothetical protein [Iamia sp.]HXH57528.1 hypothetical protein [Iamia sp.]
MLGTRGARPRDSPGAGRWERPLQSYASDLVAGNTNDKGDVFTVDRTTGTTTRVTDGNDDSYDPAVSADGRHITFHSRASDLVPGDANGRTDVFTWDRTTGVITRITDGNDDSGGAAISSDGRHITFGSFASDLVADDTNGERDLFVWDQVTSTTTRISDGTGGWSYPTISADGSQVAFSSAGSPLAPDDTDGHHDVFVWSHLG